MEQITLKSTENVVSPLLFGTNLEHTRADIFGGLSAEMLKNRKFAGKPQPVSGCAFEWFPIGTDGYLSFEAPYTCHAETGYHMKRMLEMNAQRITNFSGTGEVGIGQHGLSFRKGTALTFAVVTKVAAPATVSVRLTDRYGKVSYAAAEISLSASDWQRTELTLVPEGTDADGDLRIVLPQAGDVTLGAVSLMNADHFRGMRRDVIENLKALHISILRWPGGNFAGEYCWFDGLLPRDMRAPLQSFLGLETQPCSMGFDYDEINTDDFIALCREIGAQPFLTINAAWNTPEENAAWVEYCNGDKTTKYGAVRAQRGNPEPYGVLYWSLGNEAGYGHMEGDNTPEGYCRLARANAEAMLAVSPDLNLCMSGPNPDAQWAEKAAKPLSDKVRFLSLHHYSKEPDFANRDRKAVYTSILNGVRRARTERVYGTAKLLPAGMQISYDEWNLWYAWYRSVGVGEAMYYAGMLQMLMEEAAPCHIGIACQFEAVNEGMIEVQPYESALSAAGQMFSLYAQSHAGGEIAYQSDAVTVTKKDGVYTMTAVNFQYDGESTVQLPENAEIRKAELYTNESILPGSRFQVLPAKPQGGAWKIPAHSVLMVQFTEE